MGLLPVVGKAHEAAAGAPFVWFAYGSSLDRAAFALWAGEHGYRMPDVARAVPARLEGFRLAFDVESRFWGGTVASLREAPGESVEGIAWSLPGEARGLVDHKEGAISGLYTAFPVTVTPLEAGAPLAAMAYRAARPAAKEGPPAPRYKDALLRGAEEWRLSPGWWARIAAL